MKPPLKRRIIEWFCKVFGHNNEYSHIYAGKKHYHCKRCGGLTEVPLTWQERIILEQVEEEEQ